MELTNIKTCFLAGAMINSADKWADRYEIKWRKEAYEYFNKYIDGFNISMPPEFWTTEDYSCNGKETLRFDMRNIRESDIILVNLKDLESSFSTSDEIFYGYLSQKPVIGFLEEETEETAVIHPWKREQLDKIFFGKGAMKCAIQYIATYYER